MNLYDVSVPIFRKNLLNLRAILEKGEAFAETNGLVPEEMLQAQLAPDMFPLVRQVQIATDNAKGISARLCGLEPPKMEDTEKTFSELYARIDRTVAFLDTLKREQFEEGASRHIAFPYEEGKYLLGKDFLLEMSLPNFFFHVVTAYDILRHEGVQIGKNDFIGSLSLHNS